MMVPFWSVGRRTSREFGRVTSARGRGGCMRDGFGCENHISFSYNAYICMFRDGIHNAVGSAYLPVSMTALVNDSSDVV